MELREPLSLLTGSGLRVLVNSKRLLIRRLPKMKVIVLIVPNYCEWIKKADKEYERWRTMFYDIIEHAQKVYPFVFLDLKDSEMSNERKCFSDIEHLNYYGAVKFSKLLESFID